MQNSVEVVRGFYEALERGDLDAATASFADDCEIELLGPKTIPFAGVYKGPTGMKQFLETFLGTSDIVDFGQDELHGDGNFVTVLGHEHARSKATGREWTTRLVDMYEVHDGKIHKFLCAYDTAAVANAFESAPAAKAS